MRIKKIRREKNNNLLYVPVKKFIHVQKKVNTKHSFLMKKMSPYTHAIDFSETKKYIFEHNMDMDVVHV